MHSKEAWEKATECALSAESALDEETYDLFMRLRDRWIGLATSFEFLEAEEANHLLPARRHLPENQAPAIAPGDAGALSEPARKAESTAH